ncbi:sulfite exporter TauE/SafE family protein, partial [Acinetobacter baumannii]
MDMLLLVIAVFIFAGLVKGTLGLGLPTVAMGLMSMVISPFQAAALLIVPSMITNIWQLF